MFKYALKTYKHDTELYSHGTFITVDNISYQMLRDIDFLKVFDPNDEISFEVHLIKIYDTNTNSYPLSRSNHITESVFIFEVTDDDINDININGSKLFTQIKELNDGSSKICKFNIYLRKYLEDNKTHYVFEHPFFSIE
jgi:hypothetical protein